jgi:hypothetical protein
MEFLPEGLRFKIVVPMARITTCVSFKSHRKRNSPIGVENLSTKTPGAVGSWVSVPRVL